mmetsp:Transcript_19780/g.30371  ORF Transcript_19780/g.30371 Transcript_19780/m.30371 type:complete len:238 (+) Transcript_19780:645-1358(+)
MLRRQRELGHFGALLERLTDHETSLGPEQIDIVSILHNTRNLGHHGNRARNFRSFKVHGILRPPRITRVTRTTNVIRIIQFQRITALVDHTDLLGVRDDVYFHSFECFQIKCNASPFVTCASSPRVPLTSHQCGRTTIARKSGRVFVLVVFQIIARLPSLGGVLGERILVCRIDIEIGTHDVALLRPHVFKQIQKVHRFGDRGEANVVQIAMGLLAVRTHATYDLAGTFIKGPQEQI